MNTVNCESNRFSSENGWSRSLTAKIKCREGGRTVEFVHILALSKRAAAKFRQSPPACHPVRN